MGRKGVSKRKTPKSKNRTVAIGDGTGAVSNITRASESPKVRSSGKGEAGSVNKGGKKK